MSVHICENVRIMFTIFEQTTLYCLLKRILYSIVCMVVHTKFMAIRKGSVRAFTMEQLYMFWLSYKYLTEQFRHLFFLKTIFKFKFVASYFHIFFFNFYSNFCYLNVTPEQLWQSIYTSQLDMLWQFCFYYTS